MRLLFAPSFILQYESRTEITATYLYLSLHQKHKVSRHSIAETEFQVIITGMHTDVNDNVLDTQNVGMTIRHSLLAGSFDIIATCFDKVFINFVLDDDTAGP